MIKHVATFAVLVGSVSSLNVSYSTAATSGVRILDRFDANLEAVQTDTNGEPIERGGAEVSAGQFIAPNSSDNSAFVLGTLGLDSESRFRIGTSIGGFVPGIGGEVIGSYRLLTGDHPSESADRTLTEHGFGVGYTSYFDKFLRELNITAIHTMTGGSDRFLNRSAADVGAYRIQTQTNSGFGDTKSSELELNLAFGSDKPWVFFDGYRFDVAGGYGVTESGAFHSAPSREIDSTIGSVGLRVNTKIGTLSSTYNSGVSSDTFAVGYDVAMFQLYGLNRTYLDGVEEQNVGILLRLDHIGKERDSSLFHKERDRYIAPREMRHIRSLDTTLFTATPKMQTVTTKTRELIQKPAVEKVSPKSETPKPAPTTPNTPPRCGDGICTSQVETSTTCAADCPADGPICGNSVCDDGETTDTCAADCPVIGPICGNSVCDSGETTDTCAADCPVVGSVCGNTICDNGESFESCSSDCPPPGPECGNGSCETGEDTASCSADCQPSTVCGNGSCEAGENADTCDIDCFMTACGNTVCEIGEDLTNCAADCSFCGDSFCNSDESSASCPVDCNAEAICGDGVCESTEDSGSCSYDCGSGACVCGQ